MRPCEEVTVRIERGPDHSLIVRTRDHGVVVTMAGEPAEILGRIVFRGTNQRWRFFHAVLNKYDETRPLLHLGAEAPFEDWRKRDE